LKKDEEVIGNLEKQKSIGDEQLKKSKKEIKRLKTKMIIGGVVSGVTIFSLIYMIILS
jgi:ATP-dependent protease HslVU (ClpYQ) peptidase subunit